MRRHLRTLCITLSLIFCSTSLVVALSDEEALALLREAHNILVYRGDVDSATVIYDQVASDYAGSKWAAIALLKKADLTGGPDSLPLYEQVVAEYPNTIHDISARLLILEIEHFGDLNAEIEATSLLAESLGGPSLNQVLVSTNHQATEKLFALPVETRKLLGPIYWNLWCMMSNPQGVGLERPAEAFELARLLREVFEPVEASIGRGSKACLRSLSGGEILFEGEKIQAPQVQILEPLEGVVVSSRPTFKVEIAGGDLEHRQVDLANTEFLLDGMDLMPMTAVRSEFSLQPGEPFERLTFETELTEPLAPGPHTLSLIVPVNFDETGSGTTTATRTFQVEGPSKPLTLQITLHSKHVMPHRNQRVELEVTPSAQANLVFTVYRVANRNLPNDLGEAVFFQTATAVSSSYLFTWEGQTTSGELAHNGNYELTVTAGDSSQSVSVQVNRQQGKQSWLKLSTQGLAFLGRPTLLGSLTYAALTGVTWLARFGESPEGEKVALGR